jgi:predicted permease
MEVALALVLLTGGGLFIHSLLRLGSVDPGFDPDDVLTMRLTLPWEQYSGPQIGAFFQELEERVAGLPGVESVGVGSQFPPISFSRIRLSTESTEGLDEGQLPVALATLVSPTYFEALGIPVVEGRVFTAQDVEGSEPVTVINAEAARQFFPGRSAVGRRLETEDGAMTVVGVVGTTLNQGLDQPSSPEVFAAHRQVPGWSNQLFLLVRTGVEPRSVLPAIRAQVRELDADQPIYAIQTAEEILATGTAPRRIAAVVLAIFAGFALLLAAVGIYAVVSFSVGARTREIGLRMALGAARADVRRLMVRQAMTPVIIGGAIGMAASVALGRALQDLLFEVGGNDPWTLGGVALLLTAVAMCASYLPSRRATRLDPSRTLRSE